jgi:polysaccharide export outer membrane protein
MKTVEIRVFAFVLLVLGFIIAGCQTKLLDPTQIGRFRPVPAVNVILDSLGVAEESPVVWEKAEEPRPSDIVAMETDYVLQSGDIVRISIFELMQTGISVINDYTVTETGKVSIPDVGVVQAAGLTETQLEEEIRQILSPSILKEPTVTVSLLGSQQHSFSVLGDGVSTPGRYLIPRYDYRLTDALATAGGPRQFNVSYIYVSRFAKDKQKASEPGEERKITTPKSRKLDMAEPRTRDGELETKTPTTEITEPKRTNNEIPEPKEPAGRKELEREMLDMISPSAQRNWPTSDKVVAASSKVSVRQEPAGEIPPKGFELLSPRKQNDLYAKQVVQSPVELGDSTSNVVQNPIQQQQPRVEWIFQDGKWIPVQIGLSDSTEKAGEAQPTDSGIDWIFRDGKWIPIQKGQPAPKKPALKFEPEGPAVPLDQEEKLPFEMEWDRAVQTRLIKIPADKLLAGDPRYNIIIKPGDTIHVPVDIVGEFCIMGNVNGSGYINITGRPMTLKMAIAAAGGLGPLAWPKSCEVVRRIGEKREEVVMVDLDKIAAGEQPDFFIKPNDLINVGTHPTSRWRAILRNAFRAAYGFGFVYDRNFADADYGKGWPQWIKI